ncbi:hypothetical protein GE09DRAFT_1191308 [Coniochaeta sp. 2T2.1]|nr:hypothetical protein GE09DRAFT_1191308 [Coniochaeta sp. 2T2.1]
MSAKSSPSPRQGPRAQVDESSLPQGHCRYILLLSEIKGQRCACVNFALNRGMPGATCDCGHLACFHNKEPEPTEMDLLKQRIKDLEDRLLGQAAVARDRDEEASQAILTRVSGLEEEIERSREEFGQEIKRAFANSTLAWNSFHQVQQKVDVQEGQMNHVLNRLAGVDSTLQRLDDRQLELQDADTYLEERIEYIQETLDENEKEKEKEKEKPHTRGRDPRPRHRSASASHLPNGRNHPLGHSHPPLGSTRRRSPSPVTPGRASRVPPTSNPTSPAATTGIWTVHISLLPHATIPMPFERNTNAYLRCLSRGLHQVVAIRGPTAEAFCAAVNKAFSPLLRGRPWMPLQAELCNAQTLQGLPMLRQLDPSLISTSLYSADFLRRHCAVLDAGGMMESLYITMREPHALSWHAVRRAPVFTEGLEESWEFDPLLDNDPFDDDDVAVDDDVRPAAGDIVPAFPSLKRTASEMQRSASFGSASTAVATTAGDSAGMLPRAKRTCPLPAAAKTGIVGLRRPGVGTA